MVNRERRVNVGRVPAEERLWLESRVGLRMTLFCRRGELHDGLLVQCDETDGGTTVVVLLCAVDVGDC
jgi:hypothetical protein